MSALAAPFASTIRQPLQKPLGHAFGLKTYLNFFADRSGVGVSLEVSSNQAKITSAGAVTITGGEFSINGGEYGSTGNAIVGDLIRLRCTSSDQYETTVDVVLSVNAVEYDTWTVETMAEPATPGLYGENPDGSDMLNPDSSQTVNPS